MMLSNLRLDCLISTLVLTMMAASMIHAGTVTVCQCNIYGGGRWTEQDQSVVTYDTARRFAEMVASINPPGSTHPPIAVVGMQELIQEIDRTTIETLLEEKTGVQWNSFRIAQGVNNGSGIGFFWRPDMVESLTNWNLGSKTVEILDNGYYVKFAGRLFRTVGTDEAFGVFTGKLTWGDAILNGHAITEEERRQEAVRLLDWIRNGEAGNPANPGMVSYPGTSRIITTDLNTDTGTSTWDQMNTEFADPSSQHTHNSFSGTTWMDLFGKRLDYVWWDYDSFDKRSGGFTANPVRTAHIGSDHRMVYATVNIQPVDINAPTVSITSPTAGQTIVGNYKITANATDSSGIGYVDFYVDNVKKWTDSTYPFEYMWDVTGYTAGNHTIYASAVDNSSNRMVGRSMAIQVKIVQPTLCLSIAAAKAYTDSTVVSLSNRLVTAVFTGDFYIQDADRSSGIRVAGSLPVTPGDIVDVTGTLGTSGGERYLNLLAGSKGVHTLPPLPVAMSNKNLGGVNFNSKTAGVEGGLGPNNIGLLVTTWGKITQVDSTSMYLDDGSGTNDGRGTGVRITLSGLNGFVPPQVGRYAIVTGISTIYSFNERYYRQIRPLSGADIRVED